MESIQITNIRSFAKTPSVKIRPITLLVGQNSSGKSTFARLIPLIKQSAEVRAREPFLWLGRLVDFGGVSETLSRFRQTSTLGLSIEIKIPPHLLDGRRRIFYSTGNKNHELIRLSIIYNFLEDSTTVKNYEYSVSYLSQKIDIHISEAGLVERINVNGRVIENTWFNKLLVSSWTGPFPVFVLSDEVLDEQENDLSELYKFVRANMEKRTGEERVDQVVNYLVSGPVTSLKHRAALAPSGDNFWKRRIKKWASDSDELKKLNDLVLIQQFFTDTSARISQHLKRSALSYRYVTPLRASAERYYRLQGLSIEEIDPQGQNIAMYLHNLTYWEKSDFSKWMEKFFGVTVDTQSSQGHVQLILKSADEDDQKGINLADTGFGYSQLIPILLQLWSIGFRNTSSRSNTSTPVIFSIEQPELHLHPRLQAKLADVFIDTINAARSADIDLRLIIETHSEQIISRLGVRVAKNPALREDVSVVIFDKQKMNAPTEVREIEYAESGSLKSWPYGFFEADD
ncbi:MAG: hypothetical protein EON54_03930 [Alcaligenaceae bacterium]|nr:MAG: hypothetical protein EON54_03930 [Alcaligenaceae bacterium]